MLQTHPLCSAWQVLLFDSYELIWRSDSKYHKGKWPLAECGAAIMRWINFLCFQMPVKAILFTGCGAWLFSLRAHEWKAQYSHVTNCQLHSYFLFISLQIVLVIMRVCRVLNKNFLTPKLQNIFFWVMHYKKCLFKMEIASNLHYFLSVNDLSWKPKTRLV